MMLFAHKLSPGQIWRVKGELPGQPNGTVIIQAIRDRDDGSQSIQWDYIDGPPARNRGTPPYYSTANAFDWDTAKFIQGGAE